MLKAMVKHKVKDEILDRLGRDSEDWKSHYVCTCGAQTKTYVRLAAWEAFSKHVITEATKESNDG